jgi:hypothetical protein
MESVGRGQERPHCDSFALGHFRALACLNGLLGGLAARHSFHIDKWSLRDAGLQLTYVSSFGLVT